MIVRRNPPKKAAPPPPQPTPARPGETLHKAVLGEKKMRRVWMKGMPGKGERREDPYWYVETHSREGAINDMARRLRIKADLLDAEE